MSPADLSPHQLMQKGADFFERIAVPYRTVGSMASIVHGEARFTNGIDILVDLARSHVEAFADEFSAPDFHVSIPAIRDAIRLRSQFNIIHVPSGLEIDVIQRKETEFGRMEIERGRRMKSEGRYDAWFSSVENVLLMKLRSFQDGGSEKHVRDIAGMLLIQGPDVDRESIATWEEKLGVTAEWQLVLDRLSAERWEHIVERHPELASLRDAVLKTVGCPERVLEGGAGELLAVRPIEAGKMMVVAYQETQGDGFIVTAFLTRRTRQLDRRTQRWP